MARIAVLGTGIMGGPMARNLVRAGHEVTIWNRTEAKARALEQDGPHVRFDVFEVWVQRPAELEHRRREVDQGHIEVRLQVRGVIAASQGRLGRPPLPDPRPASNRPRR